MTPGRQERLAGYSRTFWEDTIDRYYLHDKDNSGEEINVEVEGRGQGWGAWEGKCLKCYLSSSERSESDAEHWARSHLRLWHDIWTPYRSSTRW
jgi:hypothetical protein